MAESKLRGDSMDEADLMTVGEFADLLGTTKATLHHYDNLNILKPAHVSETGYRYYHRDQAQTYLIVLMFTSCGLTLKQVGGYLETFDKEHGLQLVSEAEAALHDTMRKLSQLALLMSSKRQWYEAACEGDNWKPFVKTLPDGPYFNAAPASFKNTMRNKKMHTTHSISIIKYVMQYGEFPEYPFVTKRHYTRDLKGLVRFSDDEVLETEEVDLHIRPKGDYLCVRCEGIRHFYEKPAKVLCLYADEAGYILEDDVYALDPINWVITRDESEYVTLFMARIKSGYKK